MVGELLRFVRRDVENILDRGAARDRATGHFRH
jgi:hypothetical protein